MIFGKLTLTHTALHTHNDSYVLSGIKGVSARRPFLSTGLLVGGLLGLFGSAFADILTATELGSLAAATAVSLSVGFGLGQLQLVSRDLAGSRIADVVYGSYRHLNRERRRIAEAVEAAKSGEMREAAHG